MSEIWEFDQSIATFQRLAPSKSDCGAMPVLRFEILNLPELQAAGRCGGRVREDPFPTVQLKLDIEGFDSDLFNLMGRDFVSEKLRQALALDPSAVRYFDIDDRASTPSVRAKNYQIMEVVAVEDVSDPERSNYEMRRPMPDMPLSPSSVTCIEFRPDAAPQHDLFYDRFFFGGLFCTDALAQRTFAAGCTGIDFSHPRYHLIGKTVLRTPRGIEEYVGWNSRKKCAITKLVQAID